MEAPIHRNTEFINTMQARNKLEGKSFLIVDDFADVRSALRSILHNIGATSLDTASNGDDTIKLLERNSYDIILCDYNLGPGKDGQQILEAVRQRKLIGLNTIFIMITAENTSEMVFSAMEYQPDGYLSKPVTKDMLRNRLERIITRKSGLIHIDTALAKNDHSQALSIINERITQKPKNLSDLLKIKGEVLILSKQYDEAASLYQNLLVERKIAWAQLGLGIIQYEKKGYAAARDLFEQLVEDSPQYLPVYDWLAKAHVALDELSDAQATLSCAIEISPKAILRQKRLGEIAQMNNDYHTAEKAFNKAVRLGKNSIYKHPSLYAGLATCKSAQGKHTDALKIAVDITKEFKRDKEAALYASMTAATAYQNAGDTESAQANLEKAETLYNQIGERTNRSVTLELVKTSAKLGHTESAERLLERVVRDNYEDENFLKAAEHTFRQAGIAGSASEKFKSIAKEMIAMNNQGVTLAKEGKIIEAVKLFEDAANNMPSNKTINLNAARVLLVQMEKQGVDPDSTGKARAYLDRVKRISPDDTGLLDVRNKLRKMVAE